MAVYRCNPSARAAARLRSASIRWATVGSVFAGLLAVAGCSGGPGAEADRARKVTVTAGTTLVAALQNTIATDKNKVGDAVSLRTIEDVRVNEMAVIPTGSTVRGEVTHIDPAGRIAGGAELTIRFTMLDTPDGASYPVVCEPFRLKGKGDAKESALEIGGGAVAGGIVGGVLGGKGDVAKGAAAGAIIGTGVAVATKGDQIVLPAGQKMRVNLSEGVTITVKPTPES